MTNEEVYGMLSYLLQEIKEVKDKLSNLEKGKAMPVTIKHDLTDLLKTLKEVSQ